MNPSPFKLSTISFALANAPGTAVSLGVRTSSTPSDMSIIRLSIDMDSGIVRMHLYPLSLAINASAIPVFPEVGSTKTVFPGVINPFFSASSMRDLPSRSLTELHGPRLSSFPTSLVPFEVSTPWLLIRRLERSIKGVLPTKSEGRETILSCLVVVLVVALVLISRFWVQDEVATSEDRLKQMRF